MDMVFRALAIYLFLVVVFKVAGRRALLQMTSFSGSWAEALLVPFLVVLAIAAALIPAIAAYRTDVAKWLQGG